MRKKRRREEQGEGRKLRLKLRLKDKRHEHPQKGLKREAPPRQPWEIDEVRKDKMDMAGKNGRMAEVNERYNFRPKAGTEGGRELVAASAPAILSQRK